jgi:hypothetical protein
VGETAGNRSNDFYLTRNIPTQYLLGGDADGPLTALCTVKRQVGPAWTSVNHQPGPHTAAHVCVAEFASMGSRPPAAARTWLRSSPCSPSRSGQSRLLRAAFGRARAGWPGGRGGRWTPRLPTRDGPRIHYGARFGSGPPHYTSAGSSTSRRRCQGRCAPRCGGLRPALTSPPRRDQRPG